MDQGYAYDENEASPYDRGTIAAIFDSRDDAKYALADLHEAGFHKTWMGVTSVEETSTASYNDPATGTTTAAGGARQVETAEGGFGASLARFFGESGRESLYEALTKRGVPHSDALALDHRMHGGGAVVTVEAKDRYDEALEILSADRGHVATDTAAAAPAAYAPPATGAVSTTQADADTRTVQLREERLSVDKETVAAGEAVIGKRVYSEDASVDVPVMHEELFIERRPVTAGSALAAGAIGQDETIRIPLMREQVVVDKRTVVREEVAIGKRAVAGTERIDGTVRHEELVVDDSAVPATAPQTSRS